MRYLYGDSSPFPPEYDFLAVVQAFVPNATRVVQLDAEIRDILKEHGVKKAQHAREIEALDGFHEVSTEALNRSLPPVGAPPIFEYARRVQESSAEVVADIKRNAAAQEAAEEQGCQAEVGRRRAEINACLSVYLAAERFAVTDQRISWRFEDGENRVNTGFHGPHGLSMVFRLRPPNGWSAPRKVGELLKGVEIPVDVRGGWFTKGVRREITSLDEHIITGVELSEQEAQIKLTKVDGKESITIDLERAGDKLRARVQHTAEAEPSPVLDAEPLAKLGQLWEATRVALTDPGWQRDQLLVLELDEVDVIKGDLATVLVKKVLGEISAMVANIARRSSNLGELCLKIESAGRREEIYVEKVQLLQHFAALGPDERAIFEPLRVAISKRPVARSVAVSDPPSVEISVNEEPLDD